MEDFAQRNWTEEELAQVKLRTQKCVMLKEENKVPEAMLGGPELKATMCDLDDSDEDGEAYNQN